MPSRLNRSAALGIVVALAGCEPMPPRPLYPAKTPAAAAPKVAPAGPTSAPPPVAAVQGAAAPMTRLVVPRVTHDLAVPDPDAPWWRDHAPGRVDLMAQPMIPPRPETTTTSQLDVQAVHDGKTLAARLSWLDDEPSEGGRLGAFSDAVALQFPFDRSQVPPVMMGAAGAPVHLFHWRAQYQRDAERGKPAIQDLYPNVSIDMYPMDFKEAPSGSKDDQEAFNPGVAIGNPQAFPKSGVDEIVAEGFSTSSVSAGHGSAGVGRWEGGRWAVVVTRPLASEGGSSVVVGEPNFVSFAVWQGGLGEVGSRKSVLMAWLPVEVLP